MLFRQRHCIDFGVLIITASLATLAHQPPGKGAELEKVNALTAPSAYSVLANESSVRGTSPAVVFRWRADGVATSPGAVKGAPAAATVYSRGSASATEFHAIRAGNFDGVNDAYVGTRPAPSQATAGLTVLAWFKADAVNGLRSLYSDQESGGGLALDIANGYLRGQFTDDTGMRRTVIASTRLIDTTRWHSAAFVVRISGTTASARLYLDDVRLVNSSITGVSGVRNSNASGCVGCEANGIGTARAATTEFFDGQISAVTVLNYPVEHNVLGSKQLSDGGIYRGFPSFHDYLANPESAGSGDSPNYYRNRTYNPYRRVADTDKDPDFSAMATLKTRLGIPFLNDKFVPQGLAVSNNGNTMWLAYYRPLPTNMTKNAGNLIVKVDLTTLKVVGTYRLRDSTGGNLAFHAGGITYLRGYLWLVRLTSAGQRLSRFDPKRVTLVNPGNAALGSPPIYDMRESGGWPVSPDGYALNSDKASNSIWMLRTSDFSLHRYSIGIDGLPACVAKGNCSTTSEERVPLPRSVLNGEVRYLQGLYQHPGKSIGSRCFSFVTSGGQLPTHLLNYCQGGAPVRKASLANGGENFDISPDGTLWIISESAAHKYQKRTDAKNQWTDFAPHIWGLSSSRYAIPAPAL